MENDDEEEEEDDDDHDDDGRRQPGFSVVRLFYTLPEPEATSRRASHAESHLQRAHSAEHAIVASPASSAELQRAPREDPQLRDALGPQLPPVHRAAPQRCLSGQSDRAVCLASGLCLSACVSLSARQSPLAPAVLHEAAPRVCQAVAGGQSPKPEP